MFAIIVRLRIFVNKYFIKYIDQFVFFTNSLNVLQSLHELYNGVGGELKVDKPEKMVISYIGPVLKNIGRMSTAHKKMSLKKSALPPASLWPWKRKRNAPAWIFFSVL